MTQIFVTHRDVSFCVCDYEREDDNWSVEGDYGFCGSFHTFEEAWACAERFAENSNGEATIHQKGGWA